MDTLDESERQLDLAADLVERTRARIEAAVSHGELPRWVLDAFDVLERASVQCGELSERLRVEGGVQEREAAGAVHPPASRALH